MATLASDVRARFSMTVSRILRSHVAAKLASSVRKVTEPLVHNRSPSPQL